MSLGESVWQLLALLDRVVAHPAFHVVELINLFRLAVTVVECAARAVRYVVFRGGCDVTVESVAGVLSRLQVHVLVIPQAAHPGLARLVVIELLQFFVEGILNQQAAALVVWAHAH